MKRTAFGFTTPEGREPALNASTSGPPSIRAKASAIWLRLEFSTQTNRTRFIEVIAMEGGQQQADSGAQQAAPLVTLGFIERTSGVQAVPSVAQAASAA